MFAWSPESGKCLPVESRIRENFACEAGIREKVYLWNPESWDLESEIQLKETGIPVTIGIHNSAFTGKNYNPVPGICNPPHEIQNPRLSWIPLHVA